MASCAKQGSRRKKSPYNFGSAATETRAYGRFCARILWSSSATESIGGRGAKGHWSDTSAVWATRSSSSISICVEEGRCKETREMNLAIWLPGTFGRRKRTLRRRSAQVSLQGFIAL